MGSASAADIKSNETQILAASNNNEVIGIDNNINDELMGINDAEEILGEDEGTFSELSGYIGSGGDISLPKKTYTYDNGNTILITTSGTIDGNGATIDMDGSQNLRIFSISNGITVTLRNMTFKNANVDGNGAVVCFDGSGTVEYCNFYDNTATGNGGAIYFESSGDVTDCDFADNKAESGGAIYFESSGDVTNSNFTSNLASMGGAICYDISATGGNVDNCIFNNHHDAVFGGAIFFSGSGNVTNSNFTDNSAQMQGGALYTFTDSSLNVSNSNFKENIAGTVGGAISFGGYANVTDCMFADNSADQHGGAIQFSEVATSEVSKSTFTNNHAGTTGGALYFEKSGNVCDSNFTNNAAFSGTGGAIYFGKSSIANVNNSNFINNHADIDPTSTANTGGGAIYFGSNSNANVNNSNFTNNYMSNGTGGGAINFEGPGFVSNSNFCNNTMKLDSHGGGAIYFSVGGTVINSNFTNSSASRGGALYFFSDGANVENCNFVNNKGTFTGSNIGVGGAIHFGAGNHVSNSNFTNNYGYSGGAISFETSIDVEKSNFINNSASNGGTIFNHGGGTGNIKDCNFTDNKATFHGGAIYMGTGARLNIINSNFINNHAGSETSSGAVDFSSYSTAEIRKCNFTKNSAGAIGAVSMYAGEVSECNFNDNFARLDAGALSFSSGGTVNNCNFTNNSAKGGLAGAIEFDASGTVTNSNFNNNRAKTYGGAVYFHASGTVTNSNFTGNNASRGSAICFDDDSYTRSVSNSILLNNRADSKSLTITRNNYTIKITFKGNDNLLNAIYSSNDVTFDNVDYWAVDGLTNTGSNTISPSDLEQGQNITITVNKAGNIEEFINVTGVNGNISFDISNGGDYIITAHHLGDLYYTDISATKKINDSAIDLAIFGPNVIANVTPGAVGNVTFTVENETGIVKIVTVDLDDSIAELDLYDLDLGKYNITAVYNGYSSETLEYLPSNNNISVDLSKYEPIIIIETASIKVGQTEVINITVNNKKDNNVIVYVNGDEYLVTDGKLILEDLTEGTYYVTAYWEGDDKYFPGFNSSTFLVYDYYIAAHNKTVYSQIVNITADSNINHEFFNGTMYFDLYFESFGTYVHFDTVEATLDDDGIWWVEYDISRIYPGYTIVNPRYEGLDDVTIYNGTITAKNICPFNITAESVDYGTKINVINNFYDEVWYVSGDITFFIGDKIYSKDVFDLDWDYSLNCYIFTIPDILAAGTYTITAVYSGDGDYASNTSTTNVTVRPIKTTIIINASDIVVDSNAIVNATLPDLATGKIILIVNGTEYEVDSRESISIPDLDVGTYEVVAIYYGDGNFTRAYAFKSFDVVKKNITITLDAVTPCYVDTPIALTATLGEAVNGSVIFTINGVNYTKVVSNSNVVTFDYTPVDNTTLTVAATFTGNERFNRKSSDSRVLTVNKLPVDINVTSNSPIIVGKQAVFTINMSAGINTTVKLEINGKTYYVALVNGNGTYNVSGLAYGPYDVNVTFDGDFKYLSATNNTTLTVNKIADYTINVTTENIVFGDNETITVILPADINPDNLVIKVNGGEKTPVSVINGIATVVVPGLTVGQYEVNVTYNDDGKYETKNNNSNMFTVSPSTNCSIILNVNNQTYGLDTTFTVTLPKGVTENVTITIDGKDYSRKPDDEGVATLTLNNLTGGLHAVTATYPGDSTYSANSTSATFTIAPAATTIDVDFTTPKLVGDDVLFDVTMPQKINGTIILRVGKDNYTVTIVNGMGSYVVTGLKNTTYDVKAEFMGNENYTGNASEVKHLAIDKVPTTIAVAVNETINVGQAAVVNVTMNKKLNGSAIVTVNGQNYTVAIIGGNGTLTLTNLVNGTYKINATFKGDVQYINSTSNTATLKVNKIATQIEVAVSEPVAYGKDAVISIELNAHVNVTVALTIDGDDYDVALIDGKGKFNASGLSSGDHEVNVTYAGDVQYVGSNDTETFTVNNATLVPDVTALNVTVLENTSFIIDVPDLFKGNVSITVDGKELYNGSVKNIINAAKLAAGDKTATVVFYGDSNYDELTLNDVIFTVSRVVPGIAVEIDDVTYPDKAVANIVVDNNANGTVNVTVDGKVFNATVKNGIAVVNLTGLNAGAKVADVEFFTDDDYNGNATTTTKFNVNKANSTIIISVEPVYVYNDTITIGLDPSYDGVVNVTINGVVCPVDNNQVVIDRIAAGDYTIVANLAGNVNYNGATNSTTFKVKQAGSNISIDVDSVYMVGDDIVITLNTENITDSHAISVFINGVAYPVDNKVVTIIGGLEVGDYIINAVLAGNENYTGSSDDKSFEVIKYNITIDLDATSPRYVGSPVNFTVTLGKIVTGDVVFTINGANYTVHVSNDNKAVYEYTPLNNETLNVVATFVANEWFNSNSTTENYDVNRVPTDVNVTVKTPVTYGEDAAITVELNATINTNVKLLIDGKVYDVALVNGKGVFNASGLSSGDHEVNVTYAGDVQYIESRNSTTFTVDNATLVPEVTALNVTVLENTSFIIDVPDLFKGNVSITIDGKELYNGSVKNIINAAKLLAGDKTATVVFYGDDNYDEKTLDNVEFTVSRVVPGIAVEIDDVTYPDKAVANIVVDNNANGTVNVTVDGKVFNGTVKNGIAVVNLTGLNAGAKVADVEFFTDDDYNDNATASVKFNVNKANSTIIISVEPVYVYNDTITIELATTGSNGTVNVTVNGKPCLVDDGKVIVNDLAAGDYTIVANLAGNVNYNGATNSTTFKVKRAGSSISIDVDSVYMVGDDIVINLITENITDSDVIGVAINGVVYPVVNKVVTIAGGLEAGEYIINATFVGNENYTASSANASFEVIKYNITIDLDATTPRYVGSPVTFTATLGEKVIGDVIFTINGANYTVHVDDNNAVYEYTPVNNETLTVVATFIGNGRYNANSTTGLFDVNKVPSDIIVTVNGPVVYGDDAVLSILLNADINTTVKLLVDGKVYDVALIGGKGVFNASGLNAGSYEVNVTYAGDVQYVESRNSTTFTVDNATLVPDVTALNVTVLENTSFIIDVPDLFKGNVSITVDGKELYNGTVKTLINAAKLTAGDKIATVVFYGDDNYDEKTLDNVEFSVSRVVPGIAVGIDDVTYPDKAVARITVDNNANGTVNVTVDGKVYNETVKNGEALVNLTGLNAGPKVAEVKFFTDDDYNDNATVSTNFNVNKANSTITISVEPEYVYNDTITIVLSTTGSNGTVNVTVNGKPCLVENGKVIINDLAAGDYTIIADLAGNVNYDGATNSTTFKVKQAGSNISIDVNPVYMVGDDIVINLITENITDSDVIGVTINGVVYPVVNNVVTIPGGLESGEYIINAILSGNENYTGSSDNVSFEVIKYNIAIDLDATAPRYVGTPVTFTATLGEKVIGDVVFTINGANYTVHVDDNNAVYKYTPLNNETLTVVATFIGNNRYNGNSTSKDYDVNRVPTDVNVTVKTHVTYGEDAAITVELNATISTNVKLLVDGKVYDVALIDGKGVFNASGLNAGPYEVNVTYAGDVQYVESRNSTTFTVDNATLVPDVTALNVTVLENTSFIIDVPDLFKGNVSITVDGKVLYNGTVKTLINADKLTAGDKIATVVFYGDDNYDEKTLDNVEFTVSKAVPGIAVEIDDVTYPDKAVARITVDNNANGTVNVTVDGKVFNGTVKNGIAVVNLTGLNAGPKVAEVKFFTDDDYNDNATARAKFNVNKANSTITISVEPEYVYNDTITIELATTGSNGTVNVTVNGKPCLVENGKVIINDLAAGDYTIIADLDGNVNYDGATNSTTFKVKQAGSNISIDVNLVYMVGDEIVIKLITENITDSDAISVTINGESYRVVNNVVTITEGLEAGEYIINAVFAGNENYTGFSANASFEVIKYNITIDLDATAPIVVGSPVTFTATLGEKVAGDVVFTINGANYTVHVSDDNDAVYEYVPVNNETLTVVATFIGNNRYNGNSTAQKELDVNAIPTKLSIGLDKTSMIVGDNAVVGVTLNPSINGIVTVNVNGTEYPVAVVNGKGDLTLTGLTEGAYNINATFSGDGRYGESTSDVLTLTVKNKTVTEMSVDVDVENGTVTIGLPENTTGNVTISVNGKVVNTTDVDDKPIVVDIGELTPGNYTIEVTYSGDDNFTSASNVTDVEVPKVADYPFVVDAVSVGDSVDITVTLPDDIDGVVLIDVGGVGYYANATNGEAKLHLDDLPNGIYDVNARYPGDDRYAPNENSTSFTIDVKDTPMNVTVEDGKVVVELPVDATGNVTVTIDGENYTVPIEDGKAVVDIPDLEPGNYTADVTYPGDGNYPPAQNSTGIEVPKVADYQFVVDAVPDGDSADITVTLPDDITGPVLIDVGGVGYYANATNGEAKLHLDDLPKGEYDVNARYPGDDRYAPNENSTSFTIDVKDTPMNVTVEDGKVVVELPVDATGNVTVTIDGENYTVPIEDGKAVVDIPDLEPGNYTADVTYPGDDNYAPAKNSTSFEVPKSSDYPMNITGDDGKIIVSVPEDATGDVTITVDGKDYTVPIEGGKAVLDTDLPPGYYDVTAAYPGNDKYAPKTVNDTIFINGYHIIVEDLVKYFSGPQKLNVSIVDNYGKGIANKALTITIHGVTYKRITDSQGMASLPINLHAGNFTAHVEVPEYEFSKDVNVEVRHTIFGFDVEKVFRNDTQYWALFLDGNGNPLVNTGGVIFNIHGVFYNRTSNATGWTKLNLGIEGGEYILTAINPVTGEMISNKITVYTLIQASDLTKYYRNESQFICRIVAPDGSYVGAGEEVNFNIHGRLYTRYTNSTGHIKLLINLEPDEYIVTSYYKDCCEGNIIKVLPVLYADDLSMKYQDGSKFVTKLVDGQGNPYPNQMITFNVNGVSYDRKTDSNGEAKLNINLQPGRYIISSSYYGSSISNQITIS